MGRGHWPEDKGGGWCQACGGPLPVRATRTGPDRIYCDEKATGRKCSRWARARANLLALTDSIVANAPRERRNAVRGKLGGQVASLGATIRYQEGVDD